MLDVDKLKAQGIQPDHWWIGRPVNISSNVILSIMDQKCTDQELLKLMKNIRTVEQEVRNLAAHEIVSVTRKWIKDCTEFEPEQIMDMMFDLAEYAGIAAARKNRDSYERMNEELRQMQWQASGMDLG